MTWRERLRPASFRGVPFEVDSSDTSFGRRQVTHQYPGKDEPWSQDLGRKARKWQVEAFLIGEDYDLARNLLLEALERKGPGKLVHPFLGERLVQVSDVRLKENTREGGVARVSITFVEAGLEKYPSQTRTGVFRVDQAATEAKATAIAEAGTSLRDSLEEDQAVAAQAVQEEAAVLEGQLNKAPVKRATEEAADFLKDVLELATEVAGLGADPQDLLSHAQETLEAMFPAIGDAEIAYLALLELADLFGLRSGDTSSGVFSGFIRTVALAESASAAARVAWPTYDDAIEVQSRITEAIDQASALATDDEFQTLQNLRAGVVISVPPEDANLPRLGSVTLPSVLSSLVVAYELHDDVEREEELIARNRVSNPTFMPAGRPLEIVVDG